MKAENGPLDPELRDGLRALRDEHRALGAPTEVEDRLMRAWDDAHRVTTTRPRSSFGRGVLATAAAGLLAATLGYWWTRAVREPSAVPLVPPTVTASSWPSDEMLALLGADPASLQVVRIRVASTTLAQNGYAVSDPDGDGLVDVAMVVGTDGIVQSVRLSPSTVLVD